MTGLPLRRKEQYGLVVLVLHAWQFLTIKHGLIELPLPSGMRIKAGLNFPCSQLDFCIRCPPRHQITHAPEILIGQHFALRNGELIHGIIRQVALVD